MGWETFLSSYSADYSPYGRGEDFKRSAITHDPFQVSVYENTGSSRTEIHSSSASGAGYTSQSSYTSSAEFYTCTLSGGCDPEELIISTSSTTSSARTTTSGSTNPTGVTHSSNGSTARTHLLSALDSNETDSWTTFYQNATGFNGVSSASVEGLAYIPLRKTIVSTYAYNIGGTTATSSQGVWLIAYNSSQSIVVSTTAPKVYRQNNDVTLTITTTHYSTAVFNGRIASRTYAIAYLGNRDATDRNKNPIAVLYKDNTEGLFSDHQLIGMNTYGTWSVANKTVAFSNINAPYTWRNSQITQTWEYPFGEYIGSSVLATITLRGFHAIPSDGFSFYIATSETNTLEYDFSLAKATDESVEYFSAGEIPQEYVISEGTNNDSTIRTSWLVEQDDWGGENFEMTSSLTIQVATLPATVKSFTTSSQTVSFFQPEVATWRPQSSQTLLISRGILSTKTIPFLDPFCVQTFGSLSSSTAINPPTSLYDPSYTLVYSASQEGYPYTEMQVVKDLYKTFVISGPEGQFGDAAAQTTFHTGNYAYGQFLCPPYGSSQFEDFAQSSIYERVVFWGAQNGGATYLVPASASLKMSSHPDAGTASIVSVTQDTSLSNTQFSIYQTLGWITASGTSTRSSSYLFGLVGGETTNLSLSPVSGPSDIMFPLDSMLFTNPAVLFAYSDSTTPYVSIPHVLFTAPGAQSYLISGRFVDDGSGGKSYVTETETQSRPIRADWFNMFYEGDEDQIFTGPLTATTRYAFNQGDVQDSPKDITYAVNLI